MIIIEVYIFVNILCWCDVGVIVNNLLCFSRLYKENDLRRYDGGVNDILTGAHSLRGNANGKPGGVKCSNQDFKPSTRGSVIHA